MEIWHALYEIAILLFAALILGIVCEKLRQSALIGYLLAGLLLGPGGFKLVHAESVSSISELGVALLLFTIGLEFSFSKLKTLGRVAFIGGTLQIVGTGFVVSLLALAMGLSTKEAIAIGAMIPLSSTACVLRILAERSELETVRGRNSLGILLMQDVAVVPLVLLVTVLATGGTPVEIAMQVGQSVLFGGLLALGFFLVAKYVLPKLLNVAALTKNRELTILLAIAMAIISTWAAHALHLSPALGAFVAGILLAESPFATQIRADVGSLKTLFVTLFFTAIGMQAQIAWIPKYAFELPLIIAAFLLIKVVVIVIVLRFLNCDHRHAIATGLCLSQIGEFSFVLASLARGTVLSEEVFEKFLLATFGTLFLTPFLVSNAEKIGIAIENKLIRKRKMKDTDAIPTGADESGEANKLRGHVIVVGNGPAGQGAVHALRSHGVPVVVIDLNPRGVALANQNGIAVIVGDASKMEVLEHAHLESAKAMIVTLPDHKACMMIIHQSKSTAPHVPVIVRSRYHMYATELESTGASAVLDEEVLMGDHLAEEILKHIRLPSEMSRVDVPINIH